MSVQAGRALAHGMSRVSAGTCSRAVAVPKTMNSDRTDAKAVARARMVAPGEARTANEGGPLAAGQARCGHTGARSASRRLRGVAIASGDDRSTPLSERTHELSRLALLDRSRRHVHRCDRTRSHRAHPRAQASVG